jgi:hypothetical protein
MITWEGEADDVDDSGTDLKVTSHSCGAGDAVVEDARPDCAPVTGGGGTQIAATDVTSRAGVNGEVDPSTSNLATAAAACADSMAAASVLPFRPDLRNILTMRPPGRTPAVMGVPLLTSAIDSGLFRPAGDGVTARDRPGLNAGPVALAGGGGGDS